MKAVKNLSVIVAFAQNRVMGYGHALPWQLADDLKYFARLTAGHVVIVGRKTHESIIKRLGHLLRNRFTIILTGNPRYQFDGCLIAHSLQEALGLVAEHAEVFVIGGRRVYEAALPLASRLYITRVLAEPIGDVLFPEYPEAEWGLVSSVYHEQDDKNEYPFRLELYKKKER